MSLDWSNERYVRAYTRDTAEMLCWPWESRAIWWLLVRKADRSGLIPVPPKLGVRGLAALISMPPEVVVAGVAGLLEDGCFREVPGGYLIPNYIEAQETPASDAKRQRDQRERRRAGASAENSDQDNTTSRAVTQHHDTSRDVTPNRTVPFLAEPNLPDSLVGSPAPACDPPTPVHALGSGMHPVALQPPAQLGPLVEHALRRLDAARREMDPQAKLIGSSATLPAIDRDQLLGKLRAIDEREREETLDHCLDVLIAHARETGKLDELRIAMLAGDRSWERWRLGSVKPAGPRAPPNSPPPQALRGAAAARAITARLQAQAEEESRGPNRS